MWRPTVRRAFGLIEVLVIVLIIGLLAVLLVPPMLSDSRTPQGKRVMSPQARARGVECVSNLRQIRQVIAMRQASEENLPPSLQELKTQGLTDAILACPDSRLPYQYDPVHGLVRCPTEGHQGY
ncbi:MAG: type II secretion system protein [Armatimonadetes bacterium]|nr:type II secretion system protein [Armatimonadota bacterium]